jgi:hypothetical protein
MADISQSLLQDRHRQAVETVKVDLETDTAFTLISAGDAPTLLKHCSAIWRKKMRLSDREWIVDVGLPPHFPDEVPTACVMDWKELHLRNPHVMDDSSICTIPNSAAIDSNNPARLVRYVFDESELILKGTSVNDFREEFTSYWNRSVTNHNQAILIVDPIEELKNPFPAIFCSGCICVASSAERLNRWVSNRTGQPSELKKEDIGVAIHLNSPLLPDAYPNTLAELVSLAEANDSPAAELIKEHLTNCLGNGLALLVQKEGDGVALGGIVFTGLGLSQIKSLEFTQGFRAGNVPADLLRKRGTKLIASSKVTRNAVTRVDHHWIHSRGGDGRDLSKKSVLLIGCGSLGGYVAHLLSRAGVGRLTMTDNDRLGWENLGRHILGASSIGRWKAEALAEELTRELPHLEFKGIPKDWRDAFALNPNIFAEHDLIISTAGDWRCERPLNELARKTQMPPVFLGWVEPYAIAGHCLVIAKKGGCFECAANTYGQFNHAIAEFNKTPISKEPGGCTHYQHYGPTALMPVASMIASTAVESLLDSPADSFLNTWVSSAEHFKSVGANLTDVWASKVSKTGYSRTFRDLWSKSVTCLVCAQTNS